VIKAVRPKANTFGFYKPVTNRYTVTRGYHLNKSSKHLGIDIAAPLGTPIFSAASGRVIYQGRRFSGYGKMILIAHDKRISTLYSHLNKIFVKAGQSVKGGQLIGAMGRTGRATGVHLHFELMEAKIPVDPEKYIKF
jgi:murein DD-endopeptidase MepM/ murein hydrolase activator NlpD